MLDAPNPSRWDTLPKPPAPAPTWGGLAGRFPELRRLEALAIAKRSRNGEPVDWESYTDLRRRLDTLLLTPDEFEIAVRHLVAIVEGAA